MTYQYFAKRGGWRFVVLFHKGHKWLKALDTATLEVYRLPASDLGHFVPCPINPRTLANRLTKRRANLKRCNVHFSKNAVAAAISKLKTQNQ